MAGLRILESDWMKAFWLITQQPEVFQTWVLCKSVVNYITLTIANISNNTILVIVKKKQFSRTNILIFNSSILLKGHFLDFKNIFMMPKCQDGKLNKGCNIIAN